MVKKASIDNPFFNEFVYDIIYKATWAQKRKLNGSFYKIIQSEKAAKAWIKKSSIEEKDILLAQLGVRFFKVYANTEISTVQGLKDIMDKYGLKKRVSSLNELIKQNFFVSSDKQFINLLCFMSSSCHTITYLLNRDYAKSSYKLTKWQKDANIETDTQIKDAIEGSNYVSQFMLHTMMAKEYMPENVGLDENELRILLYLFPRDAVYTPRTEIHNFFNGVISKGKVTNAINRMIEDRILERNMLELLSYSITGRGKEIGHDHMKRVFHATNF